MTLSGVLLCYVPAFYTAVQVAQALEPRFSAIQYVKTPETPERRRSCRDSNSIEDRTCGTMDAFSQPFIEFYAHWDQADQCGQAVDGHSR